MRGAFRGRPDMAWEQPQIVRKTPELVYIAIDLEVSGGASLKALWLKKSQLILVQSFVSKGFGDVSCGPLEP